MNQLILLGGIVSALPKGSSPFSSSTSYVSVARRHRTQSAPASRSPLFRSSLSTGRLLQIDTYCDIKHDFKTSTQIHNSLRSLVENGADASGRGDSENYLNTFQTIFDDNAHYVPPSADYISCLSRISNEYSFTTGGIPGSSSISSSFDSLGSSLGNAETFLTSLSSDLLEASSSSSLSNLAKNIPVWDSVPHWESAVQFPGGLGEAHALVQETADPYYSYGMEPTGDLMNAAGSFPLTDAQFPVSHADADFVANSWASSASSFEIADASNIGDMSNNLVCPNGAESISQPQPLLTDSIQLTTMNDDVSTSLSSQLSDLAYDNFLGNEVNKVSSGTLSGVSDSFKGVMDAASRSLSDFAPKASFTDAISSVKQTNPALSNILDSLSNTLEPISERVAIAGASSAQTIGSAAQSAANDLTSRSVNVLEDVTASALKQVGQPTLSDVGEGIFKAIQFMGNLLLKIIDIILNETADTNIALILGNVQSSIQSVIDNASYSVITTVSNFASMPVGEALRHLVALTVTISEILLKITNAIIYLLSGKTGTEWVLQATGRVNEASAQLLAQASATYDDVTHRSLSELTVSIGHFSQQVGTELITAVGSLNEEAITIDIGETLDKLVTAAQTVIVPY